MFEVLGEVEAERARQDGKWGGPANDDQYNPLDWHEMIADYNGWARRMAAMGSLDRARKRYIQIAALAVAAVEAMDRQTNRPAAKMAAQMARPVCDVDEGPCSCGAFH